MKRSEINQILRKSDAFIRSFGYLLPPFAYFTPERMLSGEAAEIRARGMGWDITDYGQGNFADMGLFLFTVRNGCLADLKQGRGMLYAEKIMISRKQQISPMHRHNLKAEDIINRGGGKLVLELFASDKSGAIDRDATVTVPVDGIARRFEAGGRLALEPGESVTLLPGVWHAFWGEGADVLVGEVSTVNDDQSDNIFEQDILRFTQVQEDEKPLHLLVSDYPGNQ
ncbi:D-lyxose/D-mannose family sugar isomerase [Profundibacter sp.]